MEFVCFIVVAMRSSVFWDITPHSVLKVKHCFEETRHIHFQGQRIQPARNGHEAGNKQSSLEKKNQLQYSRAFNKSSLQ
jgi:hypothetical protein